MRGRRRKERSDQLLCRGSCEPRAQRRRLGFGGLCLPVSGLSPPLGESLSLSSLLSTFAAVCLTLTSAADAGILCKFCELNGACPDLVKSGGRRSARWASSILCVALCDPDEYGELRTHTFPRRLARRINTENTTVTTPSSQISARQHRRALPRALQPLLGHVIPVRLVFPRVTHILPSFGASRLLHPSSCAPGPAREGRRGREAGNGLPHPQSAPHQDRPVTRSIH